MESPILIQIQGRWDYRLRMGSPRGDAPLGPSRRAPANCRRLGQGHHRQSHRSRQLHAVNPYQRCQTGGALRDLRHQSRGRGSEAPPQADEYEPSVTNFPRTRFI